MNTSGTIKSRSLIESGDDNDGEYNDTVFTQEECDQEPILVPPMSKRSQFLLGKSFTKSEERSQTSTDGVRRDPETDSKAE